MGGLFDLIGKARKADFSPLIPKIEALFLAETRKPPAATYLEHWHPSSISWEGFCPRLEVALRAAPKMLPNDRINPGLMRIFWFGTAIHKLYQNEILGPMGVLYGRWISPRGKAKIWSYGPQTDDEFETAAFQLGQSGEVVEGFQPEKHWEYLEPKVLNTSRGIVGHADGVLFLEGKWCLLDIKTINGHAFGYLKDAKPAHKIQVQLYMDGTLILKEAPKIEEGVVLYVCKNTSQEKEFWFFKDGSSLDETYTKLKIVETCLSGGMLPNRLAECASDRSAFAKRCKMCRQCFTLINPKTKTAAKRAYKQLLELSNAGTDRERAEGKRGSSTKKAKASIPDGS
jgi:hypothetical protein